ncbi:MAG: type II secretion system F family protein, partial [Acidimicrobiales bacterium]
MDSLLLAAIGLFSVIVLVSVALTSGFTDRAEVRDSLRLLGVADDDRRSTLLAPLGARTTIPLLKGMAGLGRRFTPVGYIETTRKKLTAAGRPTATDLDRFLVLRVLSVVAIPVLVFLLLGVAKLEGTGALGAVVLVGVACLLGPDASLNRQVEARAKEIRIKLPDVLDLLTISVEAGLGFEQALDRTAATVPGPLSDEFNRMLGEVRAGSRRSDAMRALEERVDVAELRSFVLAIL